VALSYGSEGDPVRSSYWRTCGHGFHTHGRGSGAENSLKCGLMAKANFTDFANLVLGATIAGLVCLAISSSHAQPTDNWVQDYVVQFLRGNEQNPRGAGVYLGNGLVITAAHVAGANTRGVRIDGLNVPANLVKRGSFPQLDLSLISMDQGKIPDSLRERDMPLCREQPPTGAPVILAAPQGITRTSIASPTLIDPEYRTKYSTLISDGSTDGKSGSGVFDAEGKCLLGILSSKFANVVDHKGIASYFVPASGWNLTLGALV
jgi:Trypsin-like peptidase domain